MNSNDVYNEILVNLDKKLNPPYSFDRLPEKEYLLEFLYVLNKNHSYFKI